jgi:hypothetical protein
LRPALFAGNLEISHFWRSHAFGRFRPTAVWQSRSRFDIVETDMYFPEGIPSGLSAAFFALKESGEYFYLFQINHSKIPTFPRFRGEGNNFSSLKFFRNQFVFGLLFKLITSN